MSELTWEILEERLGPEVPGWLGRRLGEAGSPAGWPSNSYSGPAGFEIARIVKSGAGSLYGFTAFNSDTADHYVLLFDQNSLPVASGAAPVWVPLLVPAGKTRAVAFTPHGRSFQRGLVIASSSTSSTYTATSAVFMYDAQYD